MSISSIDPKIATQEQVTSALASLADVDAGELLKHTLNMPRQIVDAIKASESYSEGELPLDHSSVHLVGLGGSAIAGQLFRDMLSPRKIVVIHRGTRPPRDKCGVVLSSYSGNTDETLEQSWVATGGLHTVVALTSGGKLEALGNEWGLPVWKMPPGLQPRAAVGWSLGLLAALLERWNVVHGVVKNLLTAAERLMGSLEQEKPDTHPLVGAALTIAEAIKDKNAVILHSRSCTGAAYRLAAQISENAKQMAFPIMMPEAMHNSVEGLAGARTDSWTFVCMSDRNDSPSLRVAMNRTIDYFTDIGFTCVPFPAAGDNSYELTLSRMLIADLTSLFIAGDKNIDPSTIDVIKALKETELDTNTNPE